MNLNWETVHKWAWSISLEIWTFFKYGHFSRIKETRRLYSCVNKILSFAFSLYLWVLWDEQPGSKRLVLKSHNHISQISSEISPRILCYVFFHLSSKCPSSRVKHCQDNLRWRKTEIECLHSNSEKSKLLVAAGNEVFSFQTAYIFYYTNIQGE